jgi:hypothetical protein
MQSTIILPSVVWYILSSSGEKPETKTFMVLSLIWLQVFTMVKIHSVVFWLTEH